MAVTVTEKPDSELGSDGEAKQKQKRYIIHGTADGATARSELAAAAPTTYDGQARQSWDVEPVFVDAANPAGSWWGGTVTYDRARAGSLDLASGEIVIRSRVGGGREHLVVPIAQRGAYAPTGETAPTAHGIGDDGRGNVAGVEIEAFAWEFEVTKAFASPGDAPTDATFAAMAPGMNDAEFSVTDSKTGRTITLAAGECLFRGGHCGPLRQDGCFEVTYSFAARPNRSNFAVGNTEITVTGDKKGHDYLWCRYAQTEDATAKRLYAKAIAAYVDQVYPEKDFSNLGI